MPSADQILVTGSSGFAVVYDRPDIPIAELNGHTSWIYAGAFSPNEKLVATAPNRLVWGSDWPHINYFEDSRMPDDAELLNLLVRWMPEAALREQVLVRNPAELYGFN